MLKRFGLEEAEDVWRQCIEEIKVHRDFKEQYADLEFDQATWEADLRAHILDRRVRYHSGVENQARTNKRVSIKQTTPGLNANLYVVESLFTK